MRKSIAVDLNALSRTSVPPSADGDGAHSRRDFLHGADRPGEEVEITGKFVRDNIGDLAKNVDLSKFIL